MDDRRWQVDYPAHRSGMGAVQPPLRVAQWNLENYGVIAPGDLTGQSKAHKRDRVANIIAHDLKAPHIIALQEVADDSGALDDGTTTATTTMQELCRAITRAGGPTYRYVEIAPTTGSDGGMPGANIRNGYLYRPDRVALYDTGRTEGDAAISATGPAHLTGSNPAALAPADPVYSHARKPLVAEFIDRRSGEQYFITNAHLSSNPYLYTHATDADKARPDHTREHARLDQVQRIVDFHRTLGARIDADAGRIHHMVLGDLNTVPHPVDAPNETSPVLSQLKRAGLRAITDALPESAYSHRIAGETATIDHMFTSPELAERLGTLERLRVNDGEETHRLSDHNPTVATINPRKALAIVAGRG